MCGPGRAGATDRTAPGARPSGPGAPRSGLAGHQWEPGGPTPTPLEGLSLGLADYERLELPGAVCVLPARAAVARRTDDTSTSSLGTGPGRIQARATNKVGRPEPRCWPAVLAAAIP